ncbi:MAG: TauD/TfdA family dioxygenase [Gammaproteobacteria bacterium]|nr:TauD/TfdA family dioxygenase [Gammaproteobacteria bacterium]
MFRINPLGEHFAVEIRGLDLREPVADADFRRIEQALHESALVCIRDQQAMQPEHHIAFSRLFGELEVHVQSSFNLPGHPEIYCISNCLDDDGSPRGLAEAGRVWHTDLSYMQAPSRCSLLHAIEVPHDAAGNPLGATLFANAAAAYAALDPDEQRMLQDLQASHSYGAIYDKIVAISKPGRQGLKPLSEAQKRKVPPATHPVVIAHPRTGVPILYVNVGTTERIHDLPQELSDALIEKLCAHIVQPRFVYTHRWQVGDLLIWDNIQTQHLAVDDYWLPQRRHMQRTTVKGPAPHAAVSA